MSDSKNESKIKPVARPDRVLSYFKLEKASLALVAFSGILYNIGLIAGPYFEGQMAQCLLDIMADRADFIEMVRLAGLYMLIILAVQVMRCAKRFYVRRFANNTSRNMRHMIYNSLVNTPRSDLVGQSLGAAMTKAVSDVDACAEGMRKFTTEVFDTGVALIAYLAMLFYYDWRLALVSCVFTPAAYFIAGRVKKLVMRFNEEYKKNTEKLNNATMDRAANILTYRVYGCDKDRNDAYENCLTDYEKSAVAANFWESTMPPLYHIISMLGVIFVLYFGGKNVAGTGWSNWDIAAFTAFLSCFIKMAVKSSKAAKLFNSVQKARVSWARIKPLMKEYVEQDTESKLDFSAGADIEVSNLSICFGCGQPILHEISFSIHSGQIIGVTGAVASGKSLLGRALLGEIPYDGSIKIAGTELRTLSLYERSRLITYLGHEPELMTDSAEENIRLGKSGDIAESLETVCLTEELREMPDGLSTNVGSGGRRLSGGQQARLALARTCFNKGKILILDDPFSAVDQKTEREIFANLSLLAKDCIVIIISHRLQLFQKLKKVLFLENGSAVYSNHAELMQTNSAYAALYQAQAGGSKNEK